MKRSEVNIAIAWAMALLKKNNIHLPEYAYWSMDQWKTELQKMETIRSVMLGWDVTDFGTNQFNKTGAVLYTVRNGKMDNEDIGVPYCEKYLLFQEGQYLPKHYHKFKTEDIINRANGVMFIQIWNVDEMGREQTDDVCIRMDGIERTFQAGEKILIYPGNSITLKPYIAHVIGAEAGCGELVAGEVSKVNDDTTDNYFLEPTSRFSSIVEDEEVLHPLCNEYGIVEQ